ncbi:MAG: CocE/NonD family hydrolase [Actinomycetota bacterium]
MARAEDVFIPMRDGVRLAATLAFPDQGPDDGPDRPAAPWPALLEALPYRKDDLTARDRAEYVRFADEFGYAVCRIDIRGTGSSEGTATGEYTEEELDDLTEVVGWLAERSWCNGNVGMFGTSWSGFNSLQVAMLRPPALKAICSIFASDDRYADDVHYFGGALKQLDLVDWPTYMDAINVLPPVPRIAGEGWRGAWERRFAAYEPWLFGWLEHQTYDDFWKHGSLREDYAAIEAATMLVTGWADGYTNIALRGMAGLTCPKRLLAGPWSHADVATSRPGPNIDLVAEMARWWDRWLRGADNGVDREPPIVVFSRRPTPPAADLVAYPGEWRFEAGWPLDRGGELELSLTDAGANRPDPGPDALEVRGDVGWTAWLSCAGEPPWGQPVDQRPDEAFSLVYDWEPRPEETEILGHPVVHARVRASVPIAYLAAKLCDVHRDGTSQLVTRGLLNLTHRDSREAPAPLEPGRIYEVTLELEVTSWVFEPGHRIRLDLAGTDWPNTWPPPTPVTLVIERQGSRIVLPVVDGPSSIARQPNLPPSRRPQRWETDGVEWEIEHDVLEKQTRAVARYTTRSEADEVAPAIVERNGGVAGVSIDDPGCAWVDASSRYVLAWPEATVSADVRSRIESDATEYRVHLEIDASEDGEVRWSRRFDRRFPRTLQ